MSSLTHKDKNSKTFMEPFKIESVKILSKSFKTAPSVIADWSSRLHAIMDISFVGHVLLNILSSKRKKLLLITFKLQNKKNGKPSKITKSLYKNKLKNFKTSKSLITSSQSHPEMNCSKTIIRHRKNKPLRLI